MSDYMQDISSEEEEQRWAEGRALADNYGQLRWFSVLYSYPSWDRNYRPQRGVRVQAHGEQEAGRKALADAPQDSRILRIQLSRRQ